MLLPIASSAPASASGLSSALQQAGRLSMEQLDTLNRSSTAEKIPFIDPCLKVA